MIALTPKVWMALGIGAVLAVLLAALGLQTMRLSAAKTELAEVRADFADERARAAAAAQRAEQAARAEEARRQKEKDHAIEEARRRAAAAAADARRADRAAGELRDQLAAFVARARETAGSAGAACGGPPAGTELDVLAQLLGEVESAGRAMAAEADRRGIAGAACERAYDSLTQENP